MLETKVDGKLQTDRLDGSIECIKKEAKNVSTAAS